MENLTFAWRYVLGRPALFAGLSGVLVAATVAMFFVSSLFTNLIHISSSSHVIGMLNHLIGGAAATVISALVVIPIFAGFTGVVFRLFDGDDDPIKGFSVLQKAYTSVVSMTLMAKMPVVFAQAVIWLALPHSAARFASTAIEALVDAALFLALPAMVRFGMRPWEAIIYSLRRFGEKPFAYLGYYIGAFVLACSGLLACGLGVLLTLGMLIVAPALLVWEQRSPAPEALSV